MSAEKGESTTDITSNSDWMSKLPSKCQNKDLFHLAIPGSHDSMSYDLDIKSSIIEPDVLKRFSKICCARKIVRRWATTQEEPIAKQLDAGVRYFDLRVARKPHDTNPTRLYFYHGLFTRTDVETILTDINDWAKAHPKEILILALSHFKGFDDTNKSHLHDHLIKFIKNLFGDKLFPSTEIPTLKSCWDKGRNVIVSYDYQAAHHPQLWSKITYYYGNSMKPAEVESKLIQDLAHAWPSKNFFVCGLNLTLPENASILKYILRLYGNLPSVIRRSLPSMVQWLKEQALKTHVNIVASDLVTSHDFVSTVVELNYKYQ
ncbi:PI-PLC X domain-containing protein 1 [Larimichthys crocea]|uniref:PI-PLC X domain-containing protein 1 n=1 Tax=Larimichthys crocea TaxID=215358 RepID=UPI00054BB4F1|nr:PI-PLC X domain-containing protein 1 [Larimichthys crocea]